MVETRRRDERRPSFATIHSRGLPAAPPDPSSRPITQEQVSLSLVDIVEELANHVPPEKRPQVELLRRFAKEKPDQHAKVKQQMLIVAGSEALRTAVEALLSSGRSKSPPPEAGAAPAALPPPPVWFSGSEPPMPPNLPAIFGSTASTPAELAEFKAGLLHAFHCHTPSCPIAGCEELASKLERLRHHVTACQVQDKSSCLLCSIYGYLRSSAPPPGMMAPLEGGVGDGGAAAAAAMSAAAAAAAGGDGGGTSSFRFADELLTCQQLLPCWDRERGRVSWMPPHEALASVQSLTGCCACGGGASSSSSSSSTVDASDAAGAAGGASSKRMRTSSSNGGGSGGLSALEAYPSINGIKQGVLQSWAAPNPYGHGGFGGQPMPRVPAPSSASVSSAAPAAASGLPMPSAADASEMSAMTLEMYDSATRGGGGGGGGHGLKRRHEASALQDSMRPPNPHFSPNNFSRLGGLSMDRTRSLNLSGNLALGEVLRSTSLSDLGLGTANLSELPSFLGLSFSKSTSELRDANVSEMSLSNLLGEGAGEIVAGLGDSSTLSFLASPRSTSRSLSNVGASGASKQQQKQELLMDIMSDFGAQPPLQPVK